MLGLIIVCVGAWPVYMCLDMPRSAVVDMGVLSLLHYCRPVLDLYHIIHKLEWFSIHFVDTTFFIQRRVHAVETNMKALEVIGIYLHCLYVLSNCSICLLKNAASCWRYDWLNSDSFIKFSSFIK